MSSWLVRRVSLGLALQRILPLPEPECRQSFVITQDSTERVCPSTRSRT